MYCRFEKFLHVKPNEKTAPEWPPWRAPLARSPYLPNFRTSKLSYRSFAAALHCTYFTSRCFCPMGRKLHPKAMSLCRAIARIARPTARAGKKQKTETVWKSLRKNRNRSSNCIPWILNEWLSNGKTRKIIWVSTGCVPMWRRFCVSTGFITFDYGSTAQDCCPFLPSQSASHFACIPSLHPTVLNDMEGPPREQSFVEEERRAGAWYR